MPPPPNPAPVPAPASALPEELLEEVFLRLPGDEPEHLVRASLASKFWLGLLSGARFRARYVDLHGAPPMLGFLFPWRSNSGQEVEDNVPHFVPTTKFRARIPDDDWGGRDYAAWDCRHGRVLLGDANYPPMTFVVWDPMTGCRKELESPDLPDDSYGAAVLCAVSGCDHRACHAGPFQVVFVGLEKEVGQCVARACLSLPVTADWSKPCSDSHFDKWSEPCSDLHLELDTFMVDMPPILMEEALHFKLAYDDDHRLGILKYDLSSHCLSLIDAPLVGFEKFDTAILVAMKNGSLGFAHVDKLTLHLWSRHKRFGWSCVMESAYSHRS
ncbi:unnamed protein product [Alopecurus aequalis]